MRQRSEGTFSHAYVLHVLVDNIPQRNGKLVAGGGVSEQAQREILPKYPKYRSRGPSEQTYLCLATR